MKRLRPKRVHATRLEPMTPLVDVVTLLLVFLLRAWSADPPVRADDPNFNLPWTAAPSPASGELSIDIGTDGIWVGDRRVTSTRWYLQNDAELIEEVFVAVQLQAPEAVTLRIDQGVPFQMLRKALYTLQQTGVRDVGLIGRSRAGL